MSKKNQLKDQVNKMFEWNRKIRLQKTIDILSWLNTDIQTSNNIINSIFIKI